MDALAKAIQARGYQVVQDGDKLRIKVGALTQGLVIEYDHALGQRVLKTGDTRLLLAYGGMLFMGMASLSGTGAAITSSLATVGLFTVLLAEIKANPVRELLARHNLPYGANPTANKSMEPEDPDFP